MLKNEDKKSVNRLKAGGLSTAVILSLLLVIQPWEGSVTNQQGLHVAYVDKLGKGNPITYCSGLTGKDYRGAIPKAGDTYTQSECDYMEAKRVASFEKDVLSSVKVSTSPLAKVDNRFTSEYQKAALISFAYNVGIGAFRSSTLLRYLNAGKYGSACDQLTEWVKSKGKVLTGLVNRRNHEYQWCMGIVDWNSQLTLNYIENNGIGDSNAK